MKKRPFIYLVATILTMATGKAYTQDLTIIDQDYQQAKQQCQKQHKMLLIDFYTSWCAPCKKLDAQIFKDSSLSREIAKTFVVLRYDAEKDTAHRLALKYHVSMYPSTVVLNTEQYIVHRLYGTGGPEKDLVKNYLAFLEETRTRNASHTCIKGVSNTNDLTYPKFYEEYVYRINIKQADEKAEAYWKATTDYISEVPFTILCYFGGGSEAVDSFFLDNKARYIERYGELDVRFVTTMIINKKVYGALQSVNRSKFDEGLRLADQHFEKKEAARYRAGMEEMMLQREGRWPEAAARFTARKDKDNLSDEAVIAFCRAAYKNCGDTTILKQCMGWLIDLSEKRP